MNIISDRLKMLCSHLGVSQRELARKAGVRESSISNYINGYCSPSQKTIKQIADAFNISPAWLMGYGKDNNLDMHSYSLFDIEEDDPRQDVTAFDLVLLNSYYAASESTRKTINILLDIENIAPKAKGES